ncbi:unnamed protein product, partial [Tetraodon nigroviridis]
MARVGHSGMTADEVTENVEAAVKTVMEKIRMVSVEEQSGASVRASLSAAGARRWCTPLSDPVPSGTLLTEGTSDEGHPHQEPGVGGSAHLQLRAEPPLSTRGGETGKTPPQKT